MGNCEMESQDRHEGRIKYSVQCRNENNGETHFGSIQASGKGRDTQREPQRTQQTDWGYTLGMVKMGYNLAALGIIETPRRNY